MAGVVRGKAAGLKPGPTYKAAGLKLGPTYGGPTRALALGLAAVALAALLQLVPLPTAALDSLSPATVTFLRGFDLEYVARGGVSHALSIRPESTWLGLGLFVALGVFLLALARGLERVGVRRLAVGLVGLGTLLAVIGIVQKALLLKCAAEPALSCRARQGHSRLVATASSHVSIGHTSMPSSVRRRSRPR